MTEVEALIIERCLYRGQAPITNRIRATFWLTGPHKAGTRPTFGSQAHTWLTGWHQAHIGLTGPHQAHIKLRSGSDQGGPFSQKNSKNIFVKILYSILPSIKNYTTLMQFVSFIIKSHPKQRIILCKKTFGFLKAPNRIKNSSFFPLGLIP